MKTRHARFPAAPSPGDVALLQQSLGLQRRGTVYGRGVSLQPEVGGVDWIWISAGLEQMIWHLQTNSNVSTSATEQLGCCWDLY